MYFTNTEAEQCVIGILIKRKDSIAEIEHTLKPKHFTNETLREIYSTALAAYKKGDIADLCMLVPCEYWGTMQACERLKARPFMLRSYAYDVVQAYITRNMASNQKKLFRGDVS